MPLYFMTLFLFISIALTSTTSLCGEQDESFVL